MTIEANKATRKTWGRFTINTLLGSGGMGDVYKAYDPNLGRYVALKILRHQEDEEVMQRFLREARSQAQVEHRHVCKIYESGEQDGRPYIAMQYIEGKTLLDMKGELNTEEIVYIMKEVAMGLHAAHKQGLIHRDVKPANIMVKKGDDGRWLPFIMDFGIAREQAAAGLTCTGMVVGTPFYMSPEHARGRQECLDRRSDVYSLGITLYELLGGDVPFRADTPMDTLLKIIQKDPVPLRKVNPRIPTDIETIVMKCLEKEPNRRYCSAKDLAEDLQNYMDGEPINARPATFTYRFKRKITKHKWPSIVGGAASVVIIILLVLWIQAQQTAAKKAEISRELGQEVERIDSTIRYAHLLPLHDISREKQQIRKRIEAIKKKIKDVGDIAFGPGHYAVGRGYLALQEYEKAKEHLEKAWKSGYNKPEVAYELGRALGKIYQKETQKADRTRDKQTRDAQQKELEKKYREPAVMFLRQGKQISGESEAFIEAQIAFYDKKYALALEKLKQAESDTSADPSLVYRIKMLEADNFLATALDENRPDIITSNLSKAEEAFLGVIRIGQSDIRGYIGLTRVLERKMRWRHHTKGGDLAPLANRAIELCRKASIIDPEKSDIFVTRAYVYGWLGRQMMVSGKKPVDTFDKALSTARIAIRKDPENFSAYTIIGIINRYKGEYNMNQGKDPTPEFQVAEENFQAAVKINPNDVMAYNGMGNLLTRKAQYETTHGRNPYPSLEKAVDTFKKALAINPNIVNLHNGLAGAHYFIAAALMADGKDPRDAYKKAAESIENAIKLNPEFSHFYSNLGWIYKNIAIYHLDYGLSPAEPVKKAVGYLQKAIEINPKANEIHLGLVGIYGILIKYDFMQNRDSSKNLEKAETYFEQALEVNPRDVRLYIRMAESSIFQAHFLLNRNQSPVVMLEQADRLLKKAASINANHYEVYGLQGEIDLLNARWNIKNKKSPAFHLSKASRTLEKAIAINPKNIRIHLIRARIHWRHAEWLLSKKQNRQAAIQIKSGLKEIDNTLEISKNFGETYAIQSKLLLLQSKSQKASDTLKKALEINNNLKYLFK